ncbi:unnamed protein product [Rhodiola kirilowii]
MEQCAKFLIRPRRNRYDMDRDLLDQEFMLKSKWFRRKDIKIRNSRGEVLECSHYVPIDSLTNMPLPCVVYCHGNSGSRVDANEAALVLLPSNITVFTFDFSGSGLSDGDHVTLGWNEKLDLKAVIDYLREDKNVSLIGLWGRSMGAVTSLMYGAEDPSIAGMILDSPFSDLCELMTELVGPYNISVVKYGVNSFIRKMRKCILRKAKFDILDLNTIKAAKSCYVPVLLGHAIGDNLVRPHHSDRIFDAYAGEKNIIKFEGGHNTPRPLCYFNAASKFFQKVMQPPGEEEIPIVNAMSDVCPEYSMTKAHESTNTADSAGTTLFPSLTISEISNSNCYEPRDPNLLAQLYFENPFMESPETPATVESEERMFVEAFMESLKDLEMRQYDVVPTPNVDTIFSSEQSTEDKLGVVSLPIGHSRMHAPSTSSNQDIHLLNHHNQYQETSAWLMRSPFSTASHLLEQGHLTDIVNDTRVIPTTVIQNPTTTSHMMDGLMRRWDPDLFRRHNHDPHQF